MGMAMKMAGICGIGTYMEMCMDMDMYMESWMGMDKGACTCIWGGLYRGYVYEH